MASKIPPADAPLPAIMQHSWEQIGNTCPFNVTHHPAISIPCGLDDHGLPFGLQIVAPRNKDAVLMRVALAVAAVLAMMTVLGMTAQRFSGMSFFGNLLPFAVGVTVLVIVTAALLLAWSKFRRWLRLRWSVLPVLLSLGLAVGCLWFVFHDGYVPVFTHFRTLVGGKQQAERVTLEHQVYAAYRRYDVKLLQAMIQRAETFRSDIEDAAEVFDLDADVLQGVAAAESSFKPRESNDGGHGLFQITAVAETLQQQVRQRLEVGKLDLNNPRHNAFVAAATLKHYLGQMNGDLFFGLLAYNIGPRNGGLRFILQQYGASDFVTMQPYLQQLPRDYPIRVLSYALAFKLWRQDGKLLAYEEGDNAVRIQRLGIPGLEGMF